MSKQYKKDQGKWWFVQWIQGRARLVDKYGRMIEAYRVIQRDRAVFGFNRAANSNQRYEMHVFREGAILFYSLKQL